MKITISKNAKKQTSVVFCFKEDKRKLPDFDCDKNEITLGYSNGQTIIYCGLGNKKVVSDKIIRTAAAKAIQKALKLKRSSISIVTDNINAYPAIEGIILGSYKYNKYKSDKGTMLSEIEIIGKNISLEKIKKIEAICKSVINTRELVNENAHIIYPESFARIAVSIAKKGKMKYSVLDDKEIKRKGMGLLTAVGQGSVFPPRLVAIEYKGNPKSKETTAIIGKGITFDAGGLNLKPTGHIEDMRCDMAGAATALGIMEVLSILKPKINVVAICCLAQNAIGSCSYFPGDVYKAYNGKTVEICNTDAEGRLILADAISYCKDIYKPTHIIDIATLTGGIIVALGSKVAGLFCNNKDFAKKLFEAGEAVNEQLWELPLYDDYADTLKSDIADLRNTSKKKGWASSITAATFLKEFVGETQWAHIDIAGTAFSDDAANGEVPQNATGFGVRLILEYLCK